MRLYQVYLRAIRGWGILVFFIGLGFLSACSHGRYVPIHPTVNPRVGLLDRWSLQVPAEKLISSRGFQWPLMQVDVTSPFGKRGRVFHEGIDLRAKEGTPVYASGNGIVLYAESRIRGYGKMIVIRHGGKLNTIYAHNSSVFVKRGQWVRQGQKIAMSGKTGHTSGPHLHFEIRKGTVAINPVHLLPKLDQGIGKSLASK